MVAVVSALSRGVDRENHQFEKTRLHVFCVRGMIMTKRDLIDEVNKRFPHLSRRDSEVIINAIFDSMVDALAQGDRIEIRGFGSFVVKHRRARQGRNPKSGALVSVAAKRVPFFKVGKELRLRVDGKPFEEGVAG
ncbi:MAG TPA: integration host factor subunit beta [Candidatus Binatia bacterium]|nr:integration host factor subunit beta [Candidatus Binatia bacterium]